MLKLLGRASSINVRKVMWLAAELGLDLPREDWGSGHRETRTPEFLALNPNGLVPVLCDGALVLWESNTICRYLASRQGRTDLLPVDPAERARVEQWMDWQATELNTAWRPAFMALVRHSPVDPAAIADSQAAWHGLMALLDSQLARTGAYAAGPAFTLADIVLGVSVHRWQATPMERPERPHVAAYLARLQQRPAYQATVPPGGP